MTEALKGRTVEEAASSSRIFHDLVTKGAGEGSPELGKLAVFSGVREFPMRVKCATLAWHTLLAALGRRRTIPSPRSRTGESHGPGNHPPPEPPTAPAPADPSDVENGIVEALKTVFDPEIPVNIYELGLIYDIDLQEDGAVKVKMTLTSPGCPVAGSLPGEVKAKVEGVARRRLRRGRAGLGSGLEPLHDVRGGAPGAGNVLSRIRARIVPNSE